jgi:hypothetical protein
MKECWFCLWRWKIHLGYSELHVSVVQDDGLGSISIGVLYLSLTLSSLAAQIFVVRLGSRRALLVGLSGYWAFIAANLYPIWFVQTWAISDSCLLSSCLPRVLCKISSIIQSSFFLQRVSLWSSLCPYSSTTNWCFRNGSDKRCLFWHCRATMIPASLFMGFTASIIWCAEVIFWFSLTDQAPWESSSCNVNFLKCPRGLW